MISAKESLTGKLNSGIIHEYPELENLEITPSMEEQHFKSEKYGYNNVIVNAIESKELNVTPNVTEQVKEGLYNKVTVAGDSNLIPENIKEGTEIFGIIGELKQGVNIPAFKIIDGGEILIEDLNPKTITISHNLGEKPDFIFIWAKDVKIFNSYGAIAGGFAGPQVKSNYNSSYGGTGFLVYVSQSGYLNPIKASSDYPFKVTENNFTAGGSSNMWWQYGKTYCWCAILMA